MRLLLDAHLSDLYVAAPLRARGHDVLALISDPLLRTLADERVLDLAAEQERVLVTRNARHFDPLARKWAAAEKRHHAGILLVWTLGTNEFNALVEQIDTALRRHPAQSGWRDLVLAI